MKSLEGKVIVVTGGGLFGRTFVQGIAAQGGAAIAADIDFAAAERVACEMPQNGPGHIEAARLDITSCESIFAMIDDIRRRQVVSMRS